MEKEVKVSVIVPVYNSEAFIRQTAEYILGQSLKDIEIIFVDDGSTDKTREILEEISKTDDRVTDWQVLRRKRLTGWKIM